MKCSLSILFLGLSALACGPGGNYQQPYYQQQPVIVQPYQQPMIVPITPRYVGGGPVLVPSTVTTQQRTTTVSPVPVQQSGSQQVRAQMQQSNQRQVAAPTTQNLGDRAGQARSFQMQQGAQQTATGFGARQQAPAARPMMAPASRPAPQFRKPGK